MKLSRIYELAVQTGRIRNPGGIKRAGKEFADSALLTGKPDTEVKRVLVGIDIDVGEILLADRIRQSRRLDLVISHHPQGAALARLPDVIAMQEGMLVESGLEASLASGYVNKRRLEAQRKISPVNHQRVVDAARLLGIPFMCLHTPADNCAADFLNRLFEKKKPVNLGEIIPVLLTQPEYKRAVSLGNGPKLLSGNPRSRCGKILLEMTGGTQGPSMVYEKLRSAGIGAVVSMHMGEEHFKNATACGLGIVIAGHIPSDTLGVNILLDSILKKENLEIECCSGFVRVERDH